MSRRSEIGAAALRLASLAAMVASLSLAAQAQDSPSANSIKNMGSPAAPAKDAKAAPNVKDAAAQATTAARSGGRKPVMRCWQEGKLLFEGAGMTPAAMGQATIELRNGSGVALQVFDLKNALCLLDYTD